MPSTAPTPAWLWPCLAAGLVFLILGNLQGDGLVSPLWWLEWGLYALMAAGLLTGGFDITLSRPWAAASFIALSWAFGMTYELTLTVDGSGLGGLHPDTRASFVLAQGDYIPIALVSLWLVRRWHLGFAGAYLIACGKSLTEGLVFTGVLTNLILSPGWPFAPLTLAYYTLAYATFVALPLLILNPGTLWRAQAPARPKGALTLIATGFALAFGIRVLWGLVLAPALTALFDLPANTVP